MAGQTVLIVDDEIAIRHFLRVALNRQGFIVSEAATGEEAVTQALATGPDVILLDVQLAELCAAAERFDAPAVKQERVGRLILQGIFWAGQR